MIAIRLRTELSLLLVIIILEPRNGMLRNIEAVYVVFAPNFALNNFITRIMISKKRTRQIS
jgi:hypothetical protein